MEVSRSSARALGRQTLSPLTGAGPRARGRPGRRRRCRWRWPSTTAGWSSARRLPETPCRAPSAASLWTGTRRHVRSCWTQGEPGSSRTRRPERTLRLLQHQPTPFLEGHSSPGDSLHLHGGHRRLPVTECLQSLQPASEQSRPEQVLPKAPGSCQPPAPSPPTAHPGGHAPFPPLAVCLPPPPGRRVQVAQPSPACHPRAPAAGHAVAAPRLLPAGGK